LQAIGEARIMLENGLPAPATPIKTTPARQPLTPVPWALTAVAILCAAVLAFLYFRKAPAEPGILEYTVLPPPNSTIHSFAISPDGRSLAIAATVRGRRSLWIRALESLQARELPGTEGSEFPFWSPDGRFIAFTAQGKLKKVSVNGGPPQIIVSEHMPRQSYPGSWSRDGDILFGTSLRRVAAGGGAPSGVLQDQHISGYPFFLPDGKRYLYTFILDPEKRGIYLGTLGSSAERRLLAEYSNAAYAPPRSGDPRAYVIFVRDGALMAQPIEPNKIEPAGEAFPLVDHVAGGPRFGFSQFWVAQNGILVYQAQVESEEARLTWHDRAGRPDGFASESGRIFDFALSPDDKRIAISRADAQFRTTDLWLRDLERGTEARFTSHPSLNYRPVWSLEGAQIYFSSTRAGRTDLYRKSAGGGSQEEPLFHNNTPKFAMDWCLGGKLLLYQSTAGILALPLSGEAKPIAIVTSEFTSTQPQLSPNGRWLAYVSDESGRNEIYVQPFSAEGSQPPNRWTISSSGGTDPRWRRDGKELFYLAGDGKLMSAPVKNSSGGVFATDSPQPLFEIPPYFGRVGTGAFRYSVTSDGKRFLVLTGPTNAVQAPLTVITNWRAAVKR
jgi:Tol biopolymer transport system component